MWACPGVPFEGDENSRLSNLGKHKIDFWDAIEMFDEPFVEMPSAKASEDRWKAVACCDDVLIAVIYTNRGGRRRIISARPANRNERERYHSHYPARGSPPPG